MVRVKICGIQTVEHALGVARLGADLIGIVFAPSPRKINLEVAGEVATALKSGEPGTALVGGFVNQDAREVNAIADRVGLDYVQLSGDESGEYCRRIQHPLLKVIHITPASSANGTLDLMKQLRDIRPDKMDFLLDSGSEKLYGGTGRSFNWRIATAVCDAFPVIIAGGLHPGNVRELMKLTHPWGVDVSSGVETRGVKDLTKVDAFISQVTAHDRESDTVE